MDNVVYILGAGFSAPLGLPVISNFLEVAHDIYNNDKERYTGFEKVFRSIKERLAYIALFYKTDLNNIEEVLSILEMERLVGGISIGEAEEFNKLILDVIKYSTPSVRGMENFHEISKGIYGTKSSKVIEGLENEVLLQDNPYRNYGEFVLGLFNLKIDFKGDIQSGPSPNHFTSFKIKFKKQPVLQSKYSVISLNYDLVLESLAYFYSTISSGDELKFNRPQENEKRDGFPVLAKLHGSVDTNTIIPPTWNKTLQEKIEIEWKKAHQILSSANHIRFIGYSLPDGDAYVKYLLKSSVINSENLKRIDVLCLDPRGETKKKYDHFIAEQYFSKYRFINGDVRQYLKYIADRNSIENGHEVYFAPPSLISIG